MTWPRLLQRSKAAAYCDMSIPSFEREIAAGRLPEGKLMGGRKHWCKDSLDAAIDRIFSGGESAGGIDDELDNRYGKAA